MPTVIRIQYQLPNAQYLDNLLTDDLILRYVKDSYIRTEHCVEYYETPEWDLAEAGFSMSANRAEEIPVVRLCRGAVDASDFPGLYRGQEWVAPYDMPEQATAALVEWATGALVERGAPPEFRTLVQLQSLSMSYFTIYSRKSTTLYLPDRTRLEMAFDSGELVLGGKRSPFYELGLELLFGDEGPMLTYCQQLGERFHLPPVLHTREQQALQLLRSR